jgi:hypothetical protein
MRFGDFAYNGGTVSHIHSQVQVPDRTGPCFATFFKDPSLDDLIKKIKANQPKK